MKFTTVNDEVDNSKMFAINNYYFNYYFQTANNTLTFQIIYVYHHKLYFTSINIFLQVWIYFTSVNYRYWDAEAFDIFLPHAAFTHSIKRCDFVSLEVAAENTLELKFVDQCVYSHQGPC